MAMRHAACATSMVSPSLLCCALCKSSSHPSVKPNLGPDNGECTSLHGRYSSRRSKAANSSSRHCTAGKSCQAFFS